MSISNKIILVISSLIAAYFAVWLGDGVAQMFARGDTFTPLMLSLFFIGATMIFGGFAFYWGFDEKQREQQFELFSFLGLIGASYCFGNFAAPVTTHSVAVWTWGGPWAVLPIIALAPVMVIVKDIIVEILAHKKRTSASVTRLRG